MYCQYEEQGATIILVSSGRCQRLRRDRLAPPDLDTWRGRQYSRYCVAARKRCLFWVVGGMLVRSPKKNKEDKMPNWRCDTCTLYNAEHYLQCDACGAERTATVALVRVSFNTCILSRTVLNSTHMNTNPFQQHRLLFVVPLIIEKPS